MSQTPAQLRIKIPPEPVWQSPAHAATGRHAHEGAAPHPVGKGKQRWEDPLLPMSVTRQYAVAGSQSAHAVAPPVPPAPPPPPAPPHAPA